MMTGLAIFFSGLARIILSIFDKTAGKDADIRIAIAGINRQSENIVNSLRNTDILKTDIVGLISIHDDFAKPELNLPILGNIEYLPRIIDQNKIHEVIITDPTLTKNEIIRIISKTSNPRVRFHLAHEYEELVAAKLANEISGIEPTVKRSNITKFRYRIAKRSLDIILSIFLLSIGRPLVYLFSDEPRTLIKKIWMVLKGKYSFIGLYPIEGEKTGAVGKIGLTGLAHISKPEQLSKVAILNLNDYYLEHYTFSIDTDIFLKFIFRKNRGN